MSLPRKAKLPETTDDVNRQSGASGMMQSLADVHRAQALIADWVVTAAEEKYGEALFVRTEAEIYRLVWENAMVRWPYIESLAMSLTQAERAMYRDTKAMA